MAIFNNVVTSRRYKPSYLCTALAPYVVRASWRTVEVVGYKELVSFCKVARSNPSKLAWIRSFSIGGRRDIVSPSRLAAVSLDGIADKLSAVTKLSFEGPSILFDAFYPLLCNLNFFPALSHLQITSSFVRWQNPFNPHHWAFLAERPAVDSFFLAVDESHADNDILASAESLAGPPPVFPSITFLGLTPSAAFTPAMARTIASQFPSLTELKLYEDRSQDDTISPFLAALPSPDKLIQLVIDTNILGQNLNAILPSFISLESLVIGGQIALEDRTFFDAFRQLPKLWSLASADGVVLNIPELSLLLDGPDKHPELCEVRLDNFEENAAGAAVARWGPWWNAEAQRWTVHEYSWEWDYDWFTEGYSAAEYDELYEAVRRGEVDLCGSTLRADEVKRVFDEEVRIVEERWGNAPPAFSDGELAYYTTKRERQQVTNMRLAGAAQMAVIRADIEEEDEGSVDSDGTAEE
ncbi:hypothetical protein JCM8097_001039 [Rhodosporidiobolus ruineniae]